MIDFSCGIVILMFGLALFGSDAINFIDSIGDNIAKVRAIRNKKEDEDGE